MGNQGAGCTFKDVVFTSSAAENKVKIQEKNTKKEKNLAFRVKINLVVPLWSAWPPAAVTAAKGA